MVEVRITQPFQSLELQTFKGLNSVQFILLRWNSRTVDACCEWEGIPEKEKPLEGRAMCKKTSRLFQSRPSSRSEALEKAD